MADEREKAVEQIHAQIRAKGKGGPTLTEAIRNRPRTNNECGQEIDMRDLGEALHHAMPSHKPLKYPD
ncbi:hypothetical protein [Mesorhizobium sp.]|uniref:hypothetical protein n=1 Tax=Mesorhizobium sp. TaxID=1871066 RepID=UPI00257C232F|nr:hypothetical protein [Mesorhizobium sp.]